MKRIILSVFIAIVLVGGLSSSAEAGPAAPIPPAWGGGSAVVDLPDFTYPAPNGCYQPTGTLTLAGNDPLGWDYFVADLTVTDSIGRITDSFYEFEDGYATSLTLNELLCYYTDTPGTYTLSGTIEFNDYPYSYRLPVSDTFVITGYTAPAPAPVATPPAPSSNNRQCVKAKQALKKAKKQNKSYNVVQRAKKKVKKVC